jgi:quercetin dioxygenase-like cupin family protein
LQRQFKAEMLVRSAALPAITLLVGVIAGIPFGITLSQVLPQFRVDVVLQRVVSEFPQPTKLEVRHDRWEPGAETGIHEHPGPAILAVLEGELVEETPASRTVLHAGQVFWRAAAQRHNVKNASSMPARMLAIHFDPAQ